MYLKKVKVYEWLLLCGAFICVVYPRKILRDRG